MTEQGEETNNLQGRTDALRKMAKLETAQIKHARISRTENLHIHANSAINQKLSEKREITG